MAPQAAKVLRARDTHQALRLLALCAGTPESETDMPRSESKLKKLARALADTSGVPYGEARREVFRPPYPRLELRLPTGVPVLAVANPKGGSGTTTLVANMAVCLARRGRHVAIAQAGDHPGYGAEELVPEGSVGAGSIRVIRSAVWEPGDPATRAATTDVVLLDVSAWSLGPDALALSDGLLVPVRITSNLFYEHRTIDHRPAEVRMYEDLNAHAFQYPDDVDRWFTPDAELSPEEQAQREELAEDAIRKWGDLFTQHAGGWAEYNEQRDRELYAVHPELEDADDDLMDDFECEFENCEGCDGPSYGGFPGGIEKISKNLTPEESTAILQGTPEMTRLRDVVPAANIVGIAAVCYSFRDADAPQLVALAPQLARVGLPILGMSVPGHEPGRARGRTISEENPEHRAAIAYDAIAQAAFAAVTARAGRRGTKTADSR